LLKQQINLINIKFQLIENKENVKEENKIIGARPSLKNRY